MLGDYWFGAASAFFLGTSSSAEDPARCRLRAAHDGVAGSLRCFLGEGSAMPTRPSAA